MRSSSITAIAKKSTAHFTSEDIAKTHGGRERRKAIMATAKQAELTVDGNGV